jgi:hypothetical protein
MTQKQSNDIYEHVLTPLWNVFDPANAASSAATAAAAKAVADAARDKVTGSNVINAALGGLGLGLSGTRLYHLMQSANKPKNTHTKFGPGAKTIDDSEKIEKISASLVDTLRQLYANTTQGIGKAVNYIDPAMHTPAVIGAAMTGLYGGSQLINGIEARKRKEEQDDMVEEAKKEYQRALMGKKHAAAFDAAFSAFSEKQADGSLLGWLANKAFDPLRAVPGGMEAYLTTTLGTGALSGKMMYDWTRARSKDKALEKARKSRARIEGAAPLYIDPEQLVAIKKLAD